jgi:hypothetical protein
MDVSEVLTASLTYEYVLHDAACDKHIWRARTNEVALRGMMEARDSRILGERSTDTRQRTHADVRAFLVQHSTTVLKNPEMQNLRGKTG